MKFCCKYIVKNGNRPLTQTEKEILHQAIDNSQNIEQLLEVAFLSHMFGK